MTYEHHESSDVSLNVQEWTHVIRAISGGREGFEEGITEEKKEEKLKKVRI